MRDVSSVDSHPTDPAARAERARSELSEPRASHSSPEVVGDRVELSEAATRHDPQADATRALEQRINEIRARIADGTYLTPDKIDLVVEQLYAELSNKPAEPSSEKS